MNINDENINSILEKYIGFTDQVSNRYKYPDNIRHLLYLIIPSFIIKYGISNESTVLKAFEETEITISSKEDNVFVAYFGRVLKEKYNDNNTTYYTEKRIVLNQYKSASLTGLMDSIIHEFNHAINSINNEIKYDEKTVSLRTGLSYINYNRTNINEKNSKDKEIALEEIINTKQSSDIINIINSFNNYNINNLEFNNTLYSIKHEIKEELYSSDAYYLQSYITKELMNNKTFMPTIENFRFKGYVDEIPYWFDNITGKTGSYNKLTKLLNDILGLESKYAKSIFFRKYLLNRIKDKISRVTEIIKDFDNKSIFK